MTLSRFILIAICVLPALALAQDPEPPPVTYPQIAAWAASVEAFVPPSWRIESQVSGDLNRDAIADVALVLKQDDPTNVLDNTGLGAHRLDTNPRILAVAFGEAAGGYHLALANHTLIPRWTEPILDDFLEDGGVSIKRGTLRVRLHLFASAGGWTAGGIAYSFRFQNRQFELIGYDSDMVERNTGETTDISINYTTRKMKVSTGNIERNATNVHWQSLPSRTSLTIDAIGDGLEFEASNPR